MSTPLLIILIALPSLLVLLLAVIFIRALLFRPKAEAELKAPPVFVNSEKATADLAEMIRCKTVSNRDKSLEEKGEFEKLEKLLPKLFPKVFAKCEYSKVGDRALLFRWRGISDKAPTVLMAHYDVVSVVEENWEKPAFSGIIENGILWGRGSLDTKVTLNGVLQAAEALIAEGFIPKNDIYFAFAGDEEINGHGATDIVNIFRERGITPGAVVDEGGAVVEKVFPGVKSPCALIGIAEKGLLNVEYSVTGGGGHSSSPAPHTPVGRLSRACVAMENKPFRFKITKPVRDMLDTLGRRSTFVYRLIFANLWCFAPVLNLLTKKTGGEMNALMRTTTAFTVMEGSKGINVIPPYAKMASNHRLIPGDTTEKVLSAIRKRVKDKGVEIKALEGTNPSVVSRIDCEGYERVALAIKGTWQDAVISPYLMVACSDSRHWGVISDKVYRFSAMALSNEERATIHGNNERIPLDTISKTVEFYIRLIKNS